MQDAVTIVRKHLSKIRKVMSSKQSSKLKNQNVSLIFNDICNQQFKEKLIKMNQKTDMRHLKFRF